MTPSSDKVLEPSSTSMPSFRDCAIFSSGSRLLKTFITVGDGSSGVQDSASSSTRGVNFSSSSREGRECSINSIEFNFQQSVEDNTNLTRDGTRQLIFLNQNYFMSMRDYHIRYRVKLPESAYEIINKLINKLYS